MTFLQGSSLFVAAVIAGMLNAIAGGGTLVTFPSLVWAGHPPLIANATNAFALAPGSISGAYGYKREMLEAPRRFLYLLIPSVAGSLIGAVLLKWTPPAVFAALVPFLILFATILFMLQEPVQRWLKTSDVSHHPATMGWIVGASFCQFLVAIYGGYFGAGMGILMLAVLGTMGLSDIHQMNGLKNIYGSMINGVAAVYFVFAELIDWPAAAVMAAGSIIGGYSAAGIARRIGRKAVRRIVIIIGFVMTISLLIRQK